MGRASPRLITEGIGPSPSGATPSLRTAAVNPVGPTTFTAYRATRRGRCSTLRAIAAVGAVALSVALTTISASPAGADTATARAPGKVQAAPMPGRYYLSLGDSLGFGLQINKLQRLLNAHHYTPFAFNTGYTDDFAARMYVLRPRLRVVNFSCPGESTVTMIGGGCFYTHSLHLTLHRNFPGAQLDTAVGFLRSHLGQVSPITLSLGGADLGPAIGDCKLRPRCIADSDIREQLRKRMTRILTQLRSAAPSSQIILLGPLNGFEVSNPGSDLIWRPFLADMAKIAAAHRAQFVSALAVIDRRGRTCVLSFLCRNGDSHPTDAGYADLTQAIWTASGYRLPRIQPRSVE